MNLSLKNALIIVLVSIITGCTKDNRTFSLKAMRLNDYLETDTLSQKLYLQVFEENNSVPLAYTGVYPVDLTLPVTFKVQPVLPMTLYNKTYRIELRGDVTGYISSCWINMDEYKIIFPIDMEVHNDSLSVSMMGSWE